MEESFELRVKRLFGSQLFESVPRSSFPASSWSVVDGQVERREWNRERGFGPDRSEDPCSSDFAEGGCFARKRRPRNNSAEEFESDMDETDDDRDEEGRREDEGEDREVDVDDCLEATDIRSSIGLDPTLDNEDEEDEFDRAAVGSDASDERLYMSDIKNHGPHLNYHSIFAVVEDDPYDGPHRFHKDPRADHLAANERIQEDVKSSENAHVSSYGGGPVAAEDVKLKPILKRKEPQDDPKPKKRVRFDYAPEAENDHPASAAAMFSGSPDVPDYLKNPSKYTHYSFDVYEDGDFGNKCAFEEFQTMMHKKPDPDPDQTADELPKSITFNHRRRAGSVDAMLACNDAGEVRGGDSGAVRLTGIAAGESFDESGVEDTAMDVESPVEDERETVPRKGRRYRSMAATDV